MTDKLRLWLSCLAMLTLVAAAGLTAAPRAHAAAGDAGQRDFTYQAAGLAPEGPTSQKPQSKLWYTPDGTWWGVLYNNTAGAYHIYRFDKAAQTWGDTGVVVDGRDSSLADVLWDGSKLYVASARTGNPSPGDDPAAYVYRFSYNGSTYSQDFRVPVGSGAMNAIVLDKDSQGKLWVTYTQQPTIGTGAYAVFVLHTTTNDQTWTARFMPDSNALPAGATTTLTADDLSAIVESNGWIGVVWSNQGASAMYYAVHPDTAADNANWQGGVVDQTDFSGPHLANNHINLKSLQADSSGRIFAALKTNAYEFGNDALPLTFLVVLNRTGSNWSHTVSTFGYVGDDHTRPIILLDTTNNFVYMFATASTPGTTRIKDGATHTAIYYKRASLSDPTYTFDQTGKGTPFILQSGTDLLINDATSTKQTVNATSGLLVEASDNTRTPTVVQDYLHNFIDLANPSPSPSPSPNPSPSPSPSPSPQPGWSAWASQGGVLTDSPAAAGFGSRVYVFAKGTDAALYVNSADAAGHFTTWRSLGGILTAAPAAASFNGRIYAFAKGSDNALYVMSSADGVNWTPWSNQGGILLAPPAAASANGRLFVFAMGTDKALYVKSTTDGVNWTTWSSLGGILTAAPAAAGFNGRIYAFAKGSDNALYVRSSADGVNWVPWQSLGGVLVAAPAAAVSGNGGTLYTFASGTGGFAYERHMAAGGAWTQWVSLGGSVIGPPAAASIPSGPLFVFVRWTDNALWERFLP
ncbi:MAG TPA: hypothetical protein VFW96_20305 [Thermomicrobiales bacterium]|nr:hypothetical protein [Thermomicrobiales bacterium]